MHTPNTSRRRSFTGLRMFCICVAALLASTLGTLAATLQLAPLFRDNAVLQRDMPLPISGKAAPGEAISVHFHGQSLRTQADSDGNWQVTLAPIPANATPTDLLVQGAQTLRVTNILVGDVWLCSGQSNMDWPVEKAANGEAETANANFPQIRIFNTAKTAAAEPQFDVRGNWQPVTPQSIRNFSAAAYYFGRELHRELGVPIGLIASSRGATQIESWMSLEALHANPAFAPVFTRWQETLDNYPEAKRRYDERMAAWQQAAEQARAEGRSFKQRRPAAPHGPTSSRRPASLYNGMIAPFVPAAIKGVIWYQGETNAVRHAEYATLFTTMIEQWRSDFRQPQLPFLFVQLANTIRKYDPTGEEFSHIREAQRAALQLPQTGMVVTIDIGDDHNVHPANKQDVGKRLALLALARVYGKAVEDSGPLVRNAVQTGDTVTIHFEHASGLHSRDPQLPGFAILPEVTGANFQPAQARIDGETIVLKVPSGVRVLRVRYAWGNTPPAPLFNGANLPASPFDIPVNIATE